MVLNLNFYTIVVRLFLDGNLDILVEKICITTTTLRFSKI